MASENTNPSNRKPSVWGKMFEGFKFAEGKNDEKMDDLESQDDSAYISHEKGGLNIVTEKSVGSTYSVSTTPTTDDASKRSLSTAFQDMFRKPAEPRRDRSQSPTRRTAQSSKESKSGGFGFFHSHNPDVDSELPPRKSSTVSNMSSHSDDSVRRPSYIPRNATTSFLKTVTGTNEEQPEKQRPVVTGSNSFRAAAVSIPGFGSTDADRTSSIGGPAGRRPSGMVPNNVANRYMRSASMTEEEREQSRKQTEGARRPSNKSRTASDTSVKAVQMGPDQYQQWQQSVQRNAGQTPFNNTTTPAQKLDKHRMQSLGSVSDVAETQDSEPRTASQPSMQSVNITVSPATPEKKNKAQKNTSVIDSSRANNGPPSAGQRSPGKQSPGKQLAHSVSPKAFQFGTALTGAGMQEDEEEEEEEEQDRRPASPLENLGFRGALPA